MKKEYEAIELEIIKFAEEEIITWSNGETNNNDLLNDNGLINWT